jgi:hypothetical protein
MAEPECGRNVSKAMKECKYFKICFYFSLIQKKKKSASCKQNSMTTFILKEEWLGFGKK